MSDLIVPNTICSQTQKELALLNNIQVLRKSVLIDLRACNFVHVKTSLCARSLPCVQFGKTFLTVLDKYTPLWKKYSRTNYANFMTKQLRKAIMKRSKLRNDFLKDRNDGFQSADRKQCNFDPKLIIY